MASERRLEFAPFALDLVNECLWRGTRAIKLRPKAFAVLEHLLRRPGQLVTKEDLIAAVWGDAFVGDAVLKVTIRQLREALDDNPTTPRFIETAHRRGYRFIGATDSTPQAPPSGVVGRDRAMSRMQGWLEKSRRGERQVVFVTGEAGIGKTTLLDMFTRSLAAGPRVRICSGQCLEQYGMGEAYLPVLEAMRQLCRDDPRAVEVLRAHAPMWLLQMPSLVTASDRDAFGREPLGGTRERMLREMAEALDALAAETPLLLVLEDLHWSDVSTLDLISYVARRRQAAHLMLVATLRPAELIASGHPLKAVQRELLARQLCEELPLDYLSEAAVAEHLAARFPANRFPAELVALIHERTEGNPLFMVNTVDHLVAERLIQPHPDGWRMDAAIETVKMGVPDSIRHVIETQIERLDGPDQRMLEAASVAGAEFSVAALSAALDDPVEDFEVRCEALCRRHQFIRECGVHILPNGDTAGRYGFVHAVHRHVLYERVSASRRIVLHRRIAERGEAVYGERANEIAAELAMHFEAAANHQKAARYLQQAAANAMLRSAYGEAITLCRHALELLNAVPDTPDRTRLELWLRLTLGVPLIATEGYAAASVGSEYERARALCDRLETAPEISQALWGLWTFRLLKGDLSAALAIATEFLVLAERSPYPGVAMRGHWAMEITCTHRGEFALALEHFDKAIALYRPERLCDDPFFDALNPGVALRCFAGWSLWFTGHPDRALIPIEEAVTLARELSEPHGLAHALGFAAVLHQLRREPDLAQQRADVLIELSAEHGLVLYQAMATLMRGWARISQGSRAAVDEMREGLAAWETTGAQLMRPHFLGLLSEGLSGSSDNAAAAAVLDDALEHAGRTGECWYLAELYRLKGASLLTGTPGESEQAEAQRCFEEALRIAAAQGAQSMELRAALSLAQLHAAGGRPDRGYALVHPILKRFTEGFDTADVREARALLDAYSAR